MVDTAEDDIVYPNLPEKECICKMHGQSEKVVDFSDDEC